MYEVTNRERHRLMEFAYRCFYSQQLKSLAMRLVEIAPDWFFVLPSSSTGKYHPPVENGKSGLIRHTLIMMKLNASLYKDSFIRSIIGLDQKGNLEEYEKLTLAILMHDFCKYYKPTSFNGEYPYTRNDHPVLIKDFIDEQGHRVNLTKEEYNFLYKEIIPLIESHSGQWNVLRGNNNPLPLPKTPQQRYVHIVDYLASRTYHNLDMPAMLNKLISSILENDTILGGVCDYKLYHLPQHVIYSLTALGYVELYKKENYLENIKTAKDIVNMISKYNLYNLIADENKFLLLNEENTFINIQEIIFYIRFLSKLVFVACNLDIRNIEAIKESGDFEYNENLIMQSQATDYKNNKATDKQINYILSLLKKKNKKLDIDISALTKYQASKLIEELK